MEKSIDDTALVFYILADRSNEYITPDDLEVVLNDVVENHPGLEFLITMPLFQSKYGKWV